MKLFDSPPRPLVLARMMDYESAPSETIEPPPPRAPRPPRRRVGTLERLARELMIAAILGILVFCATQVSFAHFQVEGSSMTPTLHNGDQLYIEKVTYFHGLFRTLQRGDVVVFNMPGHDTDHPLVKRIVALPGETIEMRDGTVYINGDPLDEPYIEKKGSSNLQPLTVPDGQYFVLGDNRVASYDSRSWGFLPRDNIIGHVWLNY